MPQSKQSDHIVLQDVNGANKTGLKLLRDGNGKLQWETNLAKALPPDIPPQDVSYAEVPAEQELVWHMSDWWLGGPKFYYNPREPAHYAIADKVHTSTPNELSMGNQPHDIPFGFANGGAELGSSGWAASTGSTTVSATAPYAGLLNFRATSLVQNDYVSFNIINAAQPAALWQSKSITVTGMAKDTAGATFELRLVESGGASTPTTTGTAVVLTTSYQSLSVTATLQPDTTQVQVRLVRTTAGGATVLDWDSFQAFPGSVAKNASYARMLTMSDGLIAASNRALWLFNETDDYFALQQAFATTITGVEVFDDRVFVGLGESTNYQYSNVGDTQTWTASTATGGTGFAQANRFAKTLNAAGAWVMAKTLNEDDVQLSTDPTLTTAATWGSVINVGKDDHLITQVHQGDGTLLVGKTDGLYQYLSLDGNRFNNVYPGAEHMVTAENFARGIMLNGWFYTHVGEVGIIRYDGQGNWQNLNWLLASPGFSDFGNRARAFGTDGDWLYIIIEDLNAASTTKASWLYRIKETSRGWLVHQMTSLILTDAISIQVIQTAGTREHSLFINGDVNGTAFCYRIFLPARTDTPRLATTRDLALSGTLTTSWMDWNMPQVVKAFNKMDVLSENLTGSTIYVTAAYQVDNESSWTNINSASSIFNTSPEQTIAFNTNVTGRRIRLRFTFTTYSASASGGPIMKAFVLHASWRPKRLNTWTLLAAIDEDNTNLQGVAQVLPAKLMLTQLANLAAATAAITMVDIDGTSWTCQITEKGERQFNVRQGTAGTPVYTRAVALTLVEVKRS